MDKKRAYGEGSLDAPKTFADLELKEPYKLTDAVPLVVEPERPVVRTKHNDRCLTTAKDDEPIFVLRAHDKTAPVVVEYWINLARSCGSPADKLAEGSQTVADMLAWQAVNGCKVPD